MKVARVWDLETNKEDYNKGHEGMGPRDQQGRLQHGTQRLVRKTTMKVDRVWDLETNKEDYNEGHEYGTWSMGSGDQ